MPIATFDQYCAMLDNAKRGRFAYPAINVTGLETLNAALEGFAEARSDGIVQVSSGGGAHATGPAVDDMALGAQVLAEAAHRLAERHDVLIALHTDHCHPKNLEPFVDPLIEVSEARVARGEPPLFNSHMFDGSELPLDENLAISKRYLERLAAIDVILEIETGVVGGEEDGHDTSGVGSEKLYTTPEEMVAAYETLQPIGRFLLAATFGNVHGVYKPGNVKLKPKILRDGQQAVQAKHGTGDEPPRPGLPRRLGLDPGGDPRDARVRRGQDERRHRHPVRLHAADRGSRVPELRRRAQDRRRGGRQEGLRPPLLPEEGDGRHEGTRGAGLRRSAQHRHQPLGALRTKPPTTVRTHQ